MKTANFRAQPTMTEMLEWVTVEHNNACIAARATAALVKRGTDAASRASEYRHRVAVRNVVVIRGVLDILDVLQQPNKPAKNSIQEIV
jgi:hypothetical protein